VRRREPKGLYVQNFTIYAERPEVEEVELKKAEPAEAAQPPAVQAVKCPFCSQRCIFRPAEISPQRAADPEVFRVCLLCLLGWIAERI